MFPPEPGTRDNEGMDGETTPPSPDQQIVQAKLLGTFAVSSAGRTVSRWPRPSARRLCQLVLVSPGRRITRDLACENLFSDLDPRAAARSVSKALTMARGTLSELGEPAAALLTADLSHIWASPHAEVDAEVLRQALDAALAMDPGMVRDQQLVAALAGTGELLADEPYADWAIRPREHLEALRQRARLTLARDRSKGAGQSGPEAVTVAWETCFEHDPAAEEAAGALIRAYYAQGHREQAARTYGRCSAALEELGLQMSAWLEEVYATAAFKVAPSPTPVSSLTTAVPGGGKALREELRTISVLAAEVEAPAVPDGPLDPESLRDAVGGLLAAVIAEVEALGGTVMTVSGSGVQAVFGAPEAHEDDPERAARAAFRALAAVAATPGDVMPRLRIGIETGPAVLGPVGGGGRVEYGAVGEAVGAAAMLRSLARPGSALVGPVTRAATDHLFTWGPAEEIPADPCSPPRVASYLGHPRPQTTKRRLRLGGRGPLIGREHEMSLLIAALREAVQGHGSVVVLTGEPGLGKTRLVLECRKHFMTWGSGRKCRWLEGRCASYTSATPYGLYQQLLAGWAGVTPDQSEALVRPAVQRALAEVNASSDVFPPLARMMGLSPGSALGRMSPGELQRTTFGAWRSLVSRLVAAGPLVLVLEDLHWADPTSLRLTLELASLTAGRRLLILATTRPDAGPEVASVEGIAASSQPGRRISLTPLPESAERDLARSLIGDYASQQVLDTVLSSAHGNPLFLEERLSSLLETRILVHEQGMWRITGTAGHAVPQALERLVRSRVDRLSPAARETICCACVLGAEFPLSLLSAVCGGSANSAALDELCAKEFMHPVDPVDTSPDRLLRFHHALIQEATYKSLLRAERRMLHGRAAWALEAASQDRPAEVAAVLGRHFAAASEAERAVRYLELAGDHATEAFANDEAISVFRAALDVIQTSAMTEAAVELLAKLANVLWRTGQRGGAREAFQRALQLARAEDRAGRLLRAHLHIRLGRLEMADLRYRESATAFDVAEKLLGPDPGHADAATAEEWLELMVDGRAGLAVHANEPEPALAALEAVRPVLEASGNPARKCSFYLHLTLARVMRNRYRVTAADIAEMRKAMAAAADSDEEKDAAYATYFTGHLLWLYGDLAAAKDYQERALAMAERIGESILLRDSLLGLTLTALRRHETDEVRALAARALTMAGAEANQEYLATARACLAWVAWQDRCPAEVIKLSGQIASANAPSIYHRWVYLFPLIAVHLDTGQVAPAVAASRQLLDVAQQALPAELESALADSADAWEHGDLERSQDRLVTGLALARDLGYC